MKKLLFLLPLLFCLYTTAQEQEFDVRVTTPSMTELINKIWIKLPNSMCTVPSEATVNSGSPECAGLALKHLRYLFNHCDISDGMKEAIKTEFKLIKLLPLGKAAGFALDVAELSAKAMMAESPEALATDLASFGFGRVVAEQAGDKLKELLGSDVTTETLNNLTKLYIDKLFDLAQESIMPSQQQYECHPQTENCKDNILVNIQPYTGDDAKVIAVVNFSADGDCGCTLACSAGTPAPLLEGWNVHGTMLLRVQSAAVVEEGSLWWKKKVLRITLQPDAPSYQVQADCDCPAGNSSNISYTAPAEDHALFIGAGLLNEDAGERFNFYGLNVAYTKPVSKQIGITGDAGVYFGKQSVTNYTKLQGLAGISYLPSAQNGKLFFQPYVLAGVANTKSKYGEGNNSYTSSNTALAAAIGTDVIFKVNANPLLGLRLDYNPAFPAGGVIHNFRIAAGVRIL